MLLAKLLVIPGKKQGWNKWCVLNLQGINHWIMNDKSIAHDFHKNTYTNRCQKGAGKGSAGAVGCSQKTGHMGGWVYKGGVGLPSKSVGLFLHSRKWSQHFEVNKKVQRFQQMTWFLKYTSQGFCYNHVWRRVENIQYFVERYFYSSILYYGMGCHKRDEHNAVWKVLTGFLCDCLCVHFCYL